MPGGDSEAARKGLAETKLKKEQRIANARKGGLASGLTRAPEVGTNERALYLS